MKWPLEFLHWPPFLQGEEAQKSISKNKKSTAIMDKKGKSKYFNDYIHDYVNDALCLMQL